MDPHLSTGVDGVRGKVGAEGPPGLQGPSGFIGGQGGVGRQVLTPLLPSLQPTNASSAALSHWLAHELALASCACEQAPLARTRHAGSQSLGLHHSLSLSLCPSPPLLQGNGGAAGLDGPKGGEVRVTVTVCVRARAHLIGPHVCHMVRREARCVSACDWVQL